MKKTLLLLIAACVVLLTGCNKMESNEKKYLKGMQSDNYEESSEAFSEFCHWLEKDRETMTYDFPHMRQEMGLKAVTSKDGHLRCYSWDTPVNDSTHIYANISQWVSGENFIAFSGPLSKLLRVNDPDIKQAQAVAHQIDTIFDVDAGGQHIYLIAQSYINIHGNRRAYVSACLINGISLVHIPFFFGGTERAGSLEFRDNQRALTPIDQLFKWDAENHRFYAYLTDDDYNLIPGKFTEYILEGDRFERVQTDE